MANECSWIVNDIHIGEPDQPERNCDADTENIVTVECDDKVRKYAICHDHLRFIERLFDNYLDKW